MSATIGGSVVALAALILAGVDGSEADTLQASLRIGGQSLFAYQVRMAHAAGARHIVALVDQMPSSMVSALDSLREDGIAVDIARDAADAADRIHPDEQLLLIADGIVADSLTVERVAKNALPILLCTDGTSGFQSVERIDAGCHWAGLALLDGHILRETASIVGEWALGPTLLRRAVQLGTARAFVEANVSAHAVLQFPQTQVEADMIARSLAAAPAIDGSATMARVYRALLNMMSPRLIGIDVPTGYVAAVPLIFALVASLLSVAGWMKAGLLLFLLAPLIAGHAQTLARISGRPEQALGYYERSRLTVAFVLLTLAGWDATQFPHAWGPLALGVWAATSLTLSNLPAHGKRDWFPEPESSALILLIASLMGQPVVGLILAVGHGLAAQIMLMRQSDTV